ncbi:MAG: hypothetical protein ACXVBW_06035, partial [Bdellovibrionota bacterium]
MRAHLLYALSWGILAFGCAPSLIGGQNNNLNVSLAPTTLTISTSAPIVAATLLTAGGQTPSIPAQYAGAGPYASSNPSAAYGGAGDAVPAGGTAAGGAGNNSPSAAPSITDATALTTYTISVSATWPSGANPTCSIPGLSSITCSLSGFNLKSSDLSSLTQGGGSLSVSGCGSSSSKDCSSSNGLSMIDFALRQVSDINVGGADSINDLAAYNNKLFALGFALYAYDPSTNVFVRDTSVLNGVTDEKGFYPAVYNNKLFYISQSAAGNWKLYSWNDATAALQQVSNVKGASTDFSDPTATGAGTGIVDNTTKYSYFKGHIQLNNKLYTIMIGSSGFTHLFEIDDIGATVKQVTKSANNTTNDFSNDNMDADKLYLYNSKIVMRGNDTAGHCKLMWFDGASQTMVTNFGGSCDNVANFTKGFDGNLYFFSNANGGGGTNPGELYSLDPTGTVPTLITNTNAVNNNLYDWSGTVPQTGLINYNNKLFFSAKVGGALGGKTKLVAFNGATITVISNIAGNGVADDPDYFTVYNNKLFFVAFNSSGKSKLYAYDDIAGTLKQVTDTSSGSGNSDFTIAWTPSAPQWGNKAYDPLLTIYNNRLFFRANSTAAGAPKLYAYDDVSGKLYLVANLAGTAAADFNWKTWTKPVLYGPSSAQRLGLVMFNSAGNN